ncbi:MAG: hypothetical protein COW78_09970 [Bdellovibrio sp. CG22_combo_CG10-13_8_21_14_all_39_27]|nr:MAG: hypothetical protein COW78_09970 [Bdellovibrio sp. CG22_combo_CG10-13_8_21_14_all_39_27]
MKEFILYLRERYNPSSYVPVISLVTVTLFHLNHYLFAFHSIPTIVLVIASILLMFRLLDDLGELAEEKKLYPHRVLSRSSKPKIYWLIFFLLFIVNVVLLFWLQKGSTIVYTFIGYTFFLKLYYHKIKKIIPSTYLKTLIPITRYPLTVYVLLSDYTRQFATSEVLFFLAFLFIALRLYDWSHDQELNRKKIVVAWLQTLYGVLLIWGLFSVESLLGMEFYILRIMSIVGFIIYAIDFHWKKFLPAFSIVHLTLILNLALLLIKQRQMLL